ncbi:MAG: zinc finger domain-containing protein [Promethearchaeota archaeon]
MSSLSKCPKCSGTGKISSERKIKCPTCHGMGSTKIIVGSKPSKKNACSDCSGSGQILKSIEKTCPVCKGTGTKKNQCIVCEKNIPAGIQLCEMCEKNPVIFELIPPASSATVEFKKVYSATMVKNTDFGFFVQLTPKVEGLIRNKQFEGNKGDPLFVKLKNKKGEKLEFLEVPIRDTSKILRKRVHDVVPFQKINTDREVGTFFSIHARIENIHQIPRGPKILTLLDETGVIEAAAFHLEFAEEIKVGDIVEVMGEYTHHRDSEQIEISDIFIVDETYANLFTQKMENLLESRSEPPKVDFMIKSETLDLLQEKFVSIAKRIRRALLELQPVIIRHHNDCDGIVAGIALETACRELWFQLFDTDEEKLRHLVKRTPNKPPFYDPIDAIRDLDFALSDQDRFGDKIPLIVILDSGSSEESLFSYNLLKSYEIEIIVIDHHFPSSIIQNTIDTHLNVYFVGGDYNICTGMLGCELARQIEPNITDTISHLPAIAGKGDRVSGDELNQYLTIAIEKDYSENFLEDIAVAVDYQAYFLKFSPGRLLLSDLLGLQGKQEKQINYVRLLSNEARKHLENQLQISLEYVQEEKLVNGIHLAILDVEKYASRFDYPPPGKITGSLFDHLAKKDLESPLVTIGLGPDFAIFRSQNVQLDFPKLVSNCSKKLPKAGIEGGGHELVGSMKFIIGAHDEITELLREMLSLIETPIKKRNEG